MPIPTEREHLTVIKSWTASEIALGLVVIQRINPFVFHVGSDFHASQLSDAMIVKQI
tara:strand:- start:11468 stop:11638 length:171 start_codon:yes stop_codon:yes gene_type:complete